ncbi:hypothetical protein HDA40_001008 [Hamadaea flava]|nr:hypothetical protein [Hamadaea flava]
MATTANPMNRAPLAMPRPVVEVCGVRVRRVRVAG